MADQFRYRRFRQEYPEEAAAYLGMGFHTYPDAVALRQRGWTPEVLEVVRLGWMEILMSKTAAGKSLRPDAYGYEQMRSVLTGMSCEAFNFFVKAGRALWLTDPPLAQQWFELVGEQSWLALDAGLSLPEAVRLLSEDRFDGESLSALAALRAEPAVE